MPIINQYLEYCKKINSPDDLTSATFEFLKEKGYDVTLFEHNPTPKALKILHTNNDKSLEEWWGHLDAIDPKTDTPIVSNDKYDYYFSNLDFQNNPIFLFAVRSNQSVIKEILSAWQSLLTIQEKVHKSSKHNAENSYGNLISQLMHDIQSLMDSNKSEDKEVERRINYQKKLNKDLLFFIRDFDLFKSEIPVKSFISDSLKLINIEPGSIKTEIIKEDLIIDIDVELFSETFNVVINNAIKAADNDLSKVSIRIYSSAIESPFLNHNWIVFEITDFGSGIAEEFEPFISKPFFTTNKHDGHTGFGLTNAEKIIKAHNGFLEIRTGKGTTVKIYLPQKNYEKK